MSDKPRRYAVDYCDTYADGSYARHGTLHVEAYTAEDAITQTRRNGRHVNSVRPHPTTISTHCPKPHPTAISNPIFRKTQASMSDTLPIPLYRRILVRRDNPDELTPSGILRSVDPEKKSCGTVIAVNAGHVSNEGALLPCESRVGDRVLFGKYSGSDIDGADFGMPELGKLVVMPESEVLLTLPPKED